MKSRFDAAYRLIVEQVSYRNAALVDLVLQEMNDQATYANRWTKADFSTFDKTDAEQLYDKLVKNSIDLYLNKFKTAKPDGRSKNKNAWLFSSYSIGHMIAFVDGEIKTLRHCRLINADENGIEIKSSYDNQAESKTYTIKNGDYIAIGEFNNIYTLVREMLFSMK